jgi:predicted alpha-1,6-mannanase (GH76 family)
LVGVLVACAAGLIGLLAPGVATPAAAAAVPAQICQGGVCDGQKDPQSAREDKILQPAVQWGRKIELHVSYLDGGMAWANISNGTQDDPVWLDRTFDGGASWEPHLGITSIPAGGTSWRTQMYWINDPAGTGLVRACGKAHDRVEVACTAWLPVCRDGRCDGADPAGAAERTPNARAWVWYRKITLHVSGDGRMAWASIDNQDNTRRDEVWIDRSWTGGNGWDGRLGDTFIPPGATGWRTWMYHFDDPAHGGSGALRACGQAEGASEIGCTPWVRSTDTPPNMHSASVDVLMGGYNSTTGMWGPGEPEAGIWLSANAFTALIDYMARTGDRRYYGTIAEMLARHPTGLPAKPWPGTYYDDNAWWGLAWIRAYDLTGDQAYLDRAESIAGQIRLAWSGYCGGGIRWSDTDPTKNTITNALYLKLAASLHRRGRGGGAWLNEANLVWTWFLHGSGNALIGSSPRLVMDGLGAGGNCGVTNANTYTYLQGVLPGALAELYRVTRDGELLYWASGIASAATAQLVTNGVLHFALEEQDEGLKDDANRYPSDGTAFKGAFVRNLRELYDLCVSVGQPTGNWRSFLLRQTQSLIDDGRSGWNEFGIHWAGPVKLGRNITFGTQLSAVDAFNASYGL